MSLPQQNVLRQSKKIKPLQDEVFIKILSFMANFDSVAESYIFGKCTLQGFVIEHFWQKMFVVDTRKKKLVLFYASAPCHFNDCLSYKIKPFNDECFVDFLLLMVTLHFAAALCIVVTRKIFVKTFVYFALTFWVKLFLFHIKHITFRCSFSECFNV